MNNPVSIITLTPSNFDPTFFYWINSFVGTTICGAWKIYAKIPLAVTIIPIIMIMILMNSILSFHFQI